MQNIEVKVDLWKKKLLDLGKRNRLLNFRETKRSNINILEPSISELYNSLVIEEKKLSFSYPVETDVDFEYNVFDISEDGGTEITIIDGDLSTNQTIIEQQKTLKSLRNRAKIAIEEQGVNVLYLAFGFLNWKENLGSSQTFRSPIILVPVTLTIESLTSPYKIQIRDDEVVLNPTLKYKLENDFNLVFPDYNSDVDNICDYLNKIKEYLSTYNWIIDDKVSLALFSFLKINMYMDLHKHHDILTNNFVVKALCGETSEIIRITEELQNYDHDKKDRPVDVFQIVDADSSQQDAIMLSKKGVSFVLQGPPGTGKSQTITNIISEALADGKKVLFVSEKMAALDVVYKRLARVGLSDFCLTLHNHKANKKEILENLGNTLNLDRIRIKEEAIYELDVLSKERELLNEYANELHTRHLPLNKTIYEVNGILAKLHNAPNIIFDFVYIGEVSAQDFRNYEYLLHNFSEKMNGMSEKYDFNVWKGSNVKQITHELRQNIEIKANSIAEAIASFDLNTNENYSKLGLKQCITFGKLDDLEALFLLCKTACKIPENWIGVEDISTDMEIAIDLSYKQEQYKAIVEFFNDNYMEDIYNIDAKTSKTTILKLFVDLIPVLNMTMYGSEKDIYNDRTQLELICKSGLSIIDNVVQQVKSTNQILELVECRNLKEIKSYASLLKELDKLCGITEVWFLDQDVTKIKNQCSLLMEILTEIKQKKQQFDISKETNEYNSLLNYIGVQYITEDENIIESFAQNMDLINKMLFDFNMTVSNLEDKFIRIEKILGISMQHTFEYAKKIINLLNYLEKPIYPTDTWFEVGGIKNAKDYLNSLEKKYLRLQELTSTVLETYEKEILCIEYKDLMYRFKMEYKSVFKIFKSNYRNDVNQIKFLRKDNVKKIEDSDIIILLNQIREIKALESVFLETNLEGQKYFGRLFQGELTSFDAIRTNLEIFSYIKNWCNDVFPLQFKQFLLNDESILSYNIEKENLEEILLSDSVYKFKQIFRGDEFSECSFLELKNTSEKARMIIVNANKINTLRNSLKQHNDNYKEYFGGLYRGEQTEFDQIHRNISSFSYVLEYFQNTIPDKIQDLILSSNNKNKFTSAAEFIEHNIRELELLNISTIVNITDADIISISDVVILLSNIGISIKKLENEFKPFIYNSKTKVSFEYLNESIAKLELMQQISDELKFREKELKDKFSFLFEGMSTNWEEIKTALDWTKDFVTFIKSENLQDDFIEKVTSQKYKKVFHEMILEINKLKEVALDDFEWINSLYDLEYQMWEMPLLDSMNKLNRCVMNLQGLEEWIDFKIASEECCLNGLASVVEVVLKEKIDHDSIIDSFKKRFFKLWLDAILPNYPAVYHFRRKSHEDMISRFKKFDLQQMKIAELRVKQMLISKLPDISKATSAVDEVGILKRELAKQRRILPIRKLFIRIPKLLPTLKPCLMMSPLSVSMFLKSELYNFDLVIFDEASQVCTENAIGAIMRAKQVVVAGDNKQLPPTNFFNVATSDNEYDVDDDNNDEMDGENYESILDEMISVFPERSLKWHYRSKNEQLITFSNIKIYNHSLITFPSSAESVADNGVEYVYVENGIYDRGGRKNNINEAKQVAKMVFEHFRNFSNRSIGVITFSEAQHQAIDEEITKIRISNPIYEPFFNEEKEDAFFVKNLENVQGDERDTIIFSIGYAKDSQGTMYMNFGPLSKNGGYRRLNVAITRAKYNIKLVGSIRPTDIRLESTNSEGVKMLRSYIEFAISGRRALETELNYNNVVDVDSPFEEAVYDFLVSKGYKVSTQIGCSGYRIDMAIHHPSIDGRFVIGIECDGATYHSSRTARERDRLRQTILEDMGWKFHRIWSTDWIKDPISEGKLLIQSIDTAIENYKDNYEKSESLKKGIELENGVNYYETEKSVAEVISESQFELDTYVEADTLSVTLGNCGTVGLCRAMKHIIEVEYPIHYELLCKRIAPIYGNQKATVKIRNEVDYGLKRIGSEIVRKEDFLYPRIYDKVVAKAPEVGSVPRLIAHISDEEIGVAMIQVVSESYGITKGCLFQIVAKAFGFSRMGINISNAFARVFDRLVNDGKLSFVEGKIMVS